MSDIAWALKVVFWGAVFTLLLISVVYTHKLETEVERLTSQTVQQSSVLRFGEVDYIITVCELSNLQALCLKEIK